MLPSRGLLRAGPSSGLARATFQLPSTRALSRQFGTALRTNNATTPNHTFRPSTSVLGSRRIGGSVAITAVSQQLFFSLRQARYASTQPAAAAVPSALPAAPSPAQDLSELAHISSTPIDLTGSDLLNIPEQIGFLKALGLDYGWGPTAVMEWALEHIYVVGGLPWWASLAALAAAMRVFIFKPSLTAAVHSQRMQDLRKNPAYDKAMKEMQESMFKGGDKIAAMEARNKMRLMNKAAGFKQWKTFFPLVNIPLGYGMFRLFRGMAALPVPSLETGGTLWFPDLTIADPYFVLPLLTAFFFVQGFRIPLPYMAPAQQKTMRIMGVVMLPLSLVFTLFLPSGIQFYFLCTGSLQFLQTWLFYQSWFRRWTGLGPLPSITGPTEPIKMKPGQWQAPRTIDATARAVGVAPKKENFYESIKGSVGAVKEKFNDYSANSDKKVDHKKSKEYQERRVLEEREKVAARRAEKSLRKRQRDT
ncbi:60Kd inner membrane protein-domain-containing protein [Lasiosphaeria ovina]|uniref:60Kd inner membrane protein-domain-containing protein n=1 Tax=Lasiosphaeria ovina TaxID=92902 RepID=A0AAE0N0G7_9PEZI|nr:60Kd inner membrane protein-domain-containing protein [Lasiosphaeria ovina]